MAKNRFAQPLYGKIIYIYETDLEKDQLATIFDPSTYWIDVTGLDVEVGYILEYVEGGGLRFVPPPNDSPLSLEETKANKIALMKAKRDAEEVKPIAYNGNLFDYDDKARDRIAAAIIALDVQGDGAKISWTTADNEDAVVTAADLRAIVAAAAVRSNLLHIAYRKAKAQVEATGSAEEVDVVTLELQEVINDFLALRMAVYNAAHTLTHGFYHAL